MKQLDLDDLPPRIALTLESLEAGEELVVVRGGLVVTRLRADPSETPAGSDPDPPAEDRLKEVMEQFNAMIHDEF